MKIVAIKYEGSWFRVGCPVGIWLKINLYPKFDWSQIRPQTHVYICNKYTKY